MIIDKDNIKILLFILVLGLGIGYAYINSDLKINGTAQVNHANWDVHWANIQVKNGSVSASSPTISNQTTVNYNITLNIPGDYYEFTVDAVNGGAIDAMVDTMEFKLNGDTMLNPPEYLNYTVTYSDGVPLEQNHLLAANTTEKYKIRVEYRTDIELNQLPATNQALNLQFAVAYRQATESAQEIEHPVTKYTANLYDEEDEEHTVMHIGQAIPNGITQYNTAAEAITALRTATGDNNIQFCLKHIVQDGVVTESYVEFVITPGMVLSNPGMTAGTYTLRGLDTIDENTGICKEKYYNSSTEECLSPYYETNKATLLRAFGNSYCIDDSYSIYCDILELSVRIFPVGDVFAAEESWGCYVYYDGLSFCSSTLS